MSAVNPPEVLLKFEYVFVSSIFSSINRYVGYLYEDEKQDKPTFQAKGVEIVRWEEARRLVSCHVISPHLTFPLHRPCQTRPVWCDR